MAFCLLTATVFWIFNALNKDHSTTIQFPLIFLYDQQKYVPSSELPGSISINVNGNGWDLLRKSLGLKVPTLTIPVERPLDVKRVQASSLTTILGSQIGNLRINYIVTDFIHVPLDEKLNRKFKLAAYISNVTFKKGYGRIGPLIILPDSVELSGPKKALLQMKDPIVIHLNFKKIDQNIHEQIEVPTGSDFINRNPPVVDIMFEVGSTLQIEKWLKIKMDKMPGGTEIDKDTVRALFEVPEQKRELFQSYALMVTIDVSGVKKGETKSIVPTVNELPTWANLVSIDSIKVKHY